jgi:endonuclease YncB( thermonuclease family)
VAGGGGPNLGFLAGEIPLRTKVMKSMTHTNSATRTATQTDREPTRVHTTPVTIATPTLATLIFILALQAHADPINPSDIRVIDGYTISVYHAQPNVRLVGFNAPETRHAACPTELELGARATRRLRDLIRDGHLEFQYVRCSCSPGTEGTCQVLRTRSWAARGSQKYEGGI